MFGTGRQLCLCLKLSSFSFVHFSSAVLERLHLSRTLYLFCFLMKNTNEIRNWRVFQHVFHPRDPAHRLGNNMVRVINVCSLIDSNVCHLHPPFLDLYVLCSYRTVYSHKGFKKHSQRKLKRIRGGKLILARKQFYKVHWLVFVVTYLL